MTDPTMKPHPVTDDLLADRLGLTVREFQRYRRQGLITLDIKSDAGVVANGVIACEQVRVLRGIRSRSTHR